MQHGPYERCRAGTGSGKADDHLPRQTGKEEDVKAGGTDENSGTEVRLFGDQRKGHEQQQAGDEVMAEFQHRLMLVEVPGEHQWHT